ncbi:MAG: multidrug ABC transporter ATP-binding protein [Thermofilum sp. ex4484_79]|nr:MAG: multidrug ABC transporter ATP-binding protein [Thermofilum sp. ex4484_79]
MKAVEALKLTKYYGALPALKDVSFTVETEDIYGLIGPNGAGKTTTFRIVAGLIPATSGTVKVFGLDPISGQDRLKRMVSYLPEDAGTYRNITGYEFLRMIAEIYFENRSDAEEALELGIKISGLGDRIHDKMKTYSKGMKRRVQVARVLMVKPRLTILDEPTAGLDVIYSREVRSIITEFSKEFGTTVLMSSHNLVEVEDICQKVALINRGRILAEGYVDELLDKYSVKNLEELFISLVRGVAE